VELRRVTLSAPNLGGLRISRDCSSRRSSVISAQDEINKEEGALQNQAAEQGGIPRPKNKLMQPQYNKSMKTQKFPTGGSMERRAQNEANCQVRLDRMVVGVPDSTGGLPQPAGFRIVSDTRVRPQGAIRTYDRVRRLESNSSSCKISIQYKRQAPWLPWSRITFIGDDRSGLTLDEIKNVLVDVPDHKISLLELALDLGPDTPVDEQFVLRHMRFGKSRRQKNRGGPGTLRFGSRGSPKLVRCYQKQKLGRYRVELELHSSLLKKLSIRNIADLPVVATKLCPAHIAFKVIRWEKLKSHLIRRYGAREGQRLYEAARERAEISLYRTTRFLRRVVHNPHRFLGPEITNRDVREALQRWAAEFTVDEEVY
jgi:hypothetical protein